MADGSLPDERFHRGKRAIRAVFIGKIVSAPIANRASAFSLLRDGFVFAPRERVSITHQETIDGHCQEEGRQEGREEVGPQGRQEAPVVLA